MCGRFSLVTNAEKLKYQFPNLAACPDSITRYNIAPGQPVFLLCETPGQGSELVACSWGLIPFWVTEMKSAHPITNARSETLMDKPVFREAYQTRRGLVIMSGFYEWQTRDGKKWPWYVSREDESLLTVASIWESHADNNGQRILSCALLTTSANSLMRPIHDRMPVIIDEANRQAWLDNSAFQPDVLTKLMSPANSASFRCYPVTPKMNNARFDSPEAIQPFYG